MDAIRALEPADFALLTRFLGTKGPGQETIARELAQPDTFIWMGLLDDDGHNLLGVHRGMKIGGFLLLKGVTIDHRLKGSTAALRLAQAMSKSAWNLGWAGVAVWVEPAKRERFLASRLQIHSAGARLHRYRIALSENVPEPVEAPDEPLSGILEIKLRVTQPLVGSLLPLANHSYGWVCDGRRLVLAGNPCGSLTDLPYLKELLDPLAKRIGAASLEWLAPAADFAGALSLFAAGARQLSRTPVQLGHRRFDQEVVL